jgi:methylated-DNA-protein-cysteine methyltransferase related protein
VAQVVEYSSADFQKAMDKSTKERSKSPVKPQEAARDVQESDAYRKRVYEIVRRIPSGRVMTYGQIADLLGEGYTARTVGFVMHAADEETTPWQRVINSQGACSTGRVILPPDKQQRMLEAEGITFDARGRCDLSRYRWIPEEEVEARRQEEQAEAQQSLFGE